MGFAVNRPGVFQFALLGRIVQPGRVLKNPRAAQYHLYTASRPLDVGFVYNSQALTRTLHFYFRRRRISSAINPPSNNINVPGSGTTTLAVNTPGTPAMV